MKATKIKALVLPALLCLAAALSCTPAAENTTGPDVVFVTTPQRVVREMLKLAGVSKDDVVYDLGSGDGRIVIAAANDFGARGVGIDIDPALVFASRRNAEREGVADKVTFLEGNVLSADITPATVVTLYMLPDMNKQLLSKLLTQLRPGARVVSHRFLIGEWKPDMTLKAHGAAIYMWMVPAHVAGSWRVVLSNESESREYNLDLKQSYQELQAFLHDNRKKFNTAALLYGNELTLSIADTVNGGRFLMEMEGVVRQGAIEGSARITDTRHPVPLSYTWKAVRRDRE